MLGIPVAKFQLNGLFSTESYLNYALGIGSNDLTNFSICERINVEYFRGTYSTFFSYATHYSDNSFVFDLRAHQNENEISLTLAAKKYPDVTGAHQIFYKFQDLRIHKKWYHICFTMRVNLLNSTTVVSVAALYINGKKVQKGIMCIR